MQYDVNSGVLQVVIEGEEINAVVGEAAVMDVNAAIDYIRSGQAEIDQAVQEGISDFNDNATSKTNDFNDNASTKTTDFNTNASNKTSSFNENYTEKLNDFNSNASDKTTDFNNNASDKTSSFNDNYTDKLNDFNSNATDKTNTFNQNATDKTTAFNNNATNKTTDFNDNATSKTSDFNTNASNKTTDFNDNYTAKKALIDAEVQTAKDWATKTDGTVDGNEYSAKYYAQQSSSSASTATTQAGLAEGSARSASNSADEAEQWAIGEPTEPAGGSAKYWAGQSAAGQVQADWTEADTTAKSYIKNKPTAGDNISLANNQIAAVSDASPTQYSTKLVQSGGVFTVANSLQNQIDAIVASSDVFDIVGTYAELQAYDITTVPVNDIIKVLVDSTHSNAATYYRCVESGGVKSWTYVGSEGPYYTKSEANTLLNDKANISLSNLSSAGQAVLDAKQDVATAVNYDNITNCITEIPQDIKLELNNGTLTLKAGSKVYVPNGFNGTTPKFDVITTTQDMSFTASSSVTRFLLVTSATSYDYIQTQYCFSGSTAPTLGTSATIYWYDTTNNLMKSSSNGGSTWTTVVKSLPVAIFTATSGAITSIDQIFNGFGYIGSTVFALPGVKGLIPNGRNEDGTLKSTEVTTQKVLLQTHTGESHTYKLQIAGGNTMYGTMYREYRDDINYNWSTYGDAIAPDYTAAEYTTSDGKIASLTPKTAFHAVDYNDAMLKSDWIQVTTAPSADADPSKFYYILES